MSDSSNDEFQLDEQDNLILRSIAMPITSDDTTSDTQHTNESSVAPQAGDDSAHDNDATRDVQNTNQSSDDPPADYDSAQKSDTQCSNKDNDIYTISQYEKVFKTQNKKYGLTKIRYSRPQIAYVRPQVRMPNKSDCPSLVIAEGVQCVIPPQKLLCPGRTICIKKANKPLTYIVLGCIWVRITLMS